ncbi:MAG: Crp/Fnr family transcriptional regulator [Anaerolineales bacterium]|nr:Crp/Fnr family transcriptional regulator [Anaerolineales bacterium]
MSLYARSSRPQSNLDAFLRTIPLFASLSPNDLADVSHRMTKHKYPSGATLFYQDTPGAMLFIIETGSVRVFGIGLTGQEHTFNTFGPGEIFGELSLLDGRPRSASAITMSPSVIWMLSKGDFDLLLERCPTFSRSLIVLLAERVRTAASHVEAIIFQDIQGRLAYELLALADRHGKPVGPTIQIEMPLTQSDLATMVGATRESVNKALTYLRGRELVQVEGNRVTVLNPEGLRRVIHERGR